MRARSRAAAVLAVLALTLPTSALPAAAGRVPIDGPDADAAGPRLLFMVAGTFDPAFDPVPGPTAMRAPLLPPDGDLTPDGKLQLMLQFDGPVTPDLIADLAARGILYERYLPDDGMIASVRPRDLPVSPGQVGARAMLPLHPVFKVAPSWWSEAGAPSGAVLRAAVLAFPGAEGALSRAGSVLAFDGRFAVVDLAPGALLPLARSASVEWVEPYAAPAPMNELLTRYIHARQAANGPFLNGTASAVWSFDDLTGTFEGIDGSGITINIADTGVDATHPTFAGRIVGSFGYGDNATCDCAPNSYPHGTHVAGIAAGNGSWRENDTGRELAKYAGVAPNASIVAQMIFNSIRTPAQYSQDAYSAGAFVNSNSWAATGGGVYTSLAEEYDALVIDANGRDAGVPQMVYSFSAGNSGRDGDTGAPSNGKNVISVGATGNGRWSPADQVAGFSSRGPASDGRIKPDLVAPGEGVDSARAAIAGCGGGEDNCSYWVASGTSMSAPAVSGAAALVAQAYRLQYAVMPSAAMVKALLIAGATPLPGYAWPGPAQGWGFIDVARSIGDVPGLTRLTWDESTALAMTPGRTNASFRLFAQGGGELRIVLQWSDVPGTTSSSKSLVNDLDLEVRAPDGKVYRGNDFLNGYSQNGSALDRGNNTEVVRLAAAQRGAYAVTVRAALIPSGEQRFALAAEGDITDRWVSLVPGAVEFVPRAPREDDPLAVILPVFNEGSQYSTSFRATATFTGPEGSDVQDANILSVRPGDDFPATFTFYPKRGTHLASIVVDPDNEGGDALPADNRAEGAVEVAGFEPTVRFVRTVASLSPASSGTFLIEVGNAGNVDDILGLAALGSNGWPAALNVTTADVAPGGTRVITGTVTAPDRALVGDLGRVRVTVASRGNSSRTASADFNITVSGQPASIVTQGSNTFTGSPGETVALAYGIENAGNVALHVHIAAAFAAPAPLGFNVTPASLDLAVDPYSRYTGSVSVAFASDALASAYRTLIVSIVSDEERTLIELPYQLSVRRIASFAIAGAPPYAEGLPGEALRFPVEIRNDGNARETFSIEAVSGSASGPRVQWVVENATLAVEARSSRFATAEAFLLRSSPAGLFSAGLKVTPPLGSPTTVTLSGAVLAVHDLNLTAPARTSVRAGGASSVSLEMVNLGNSAESVGYTVAELPPGLTVSGWSGTATLAPGASSTLSVRIGAAAGAPPSNVTLKLEVRPSTGAPFAALHVEIAVEIRPPSPSNAGPVPGFEAAASALALGAGVVLAGRARRRP